MTECRALLDVFKTWFSIIDEKIINSVLIESDNSVKIIFEERKMDRYWSQYLAGIQFDHFLSNSLKTKIGLKLSLKMKPSLKKHSRYQFWNVIMYDWSLQIASQIMILRKILPSFKMKIVTYGVIMSAIYPSVTRIGTMTNSEANQTTGFDCFWNVFCFFLFEMCL